WVNKTPEAGNVIGRARAESLQGGQQQSWWVQTPAPGGTNPATPLLPGTAPVIPAPAPAGTAPGAPAPAAKAPAPVPAAPARGSN
ncbi:MAG: hypothetical protein ABSG17_12215, partial [Spirochaetia bacterium]